MDQFCVLALRGLQLSQFVQLDAEAMSKWAFRSQMINNIFCFLQPIFVDLTVFEHVSEATLYFGFGQQFELLPVMKKERDECMLVATRARDRQSSFYVRSQ